MDCGGNEENCATELNDNSLISKSMCITVIFSWYNFCIDSENKITTMETCDEIGL